MAEENKSKNVVKKHTKAPVKGTKVRSQEYKDNKKKQKKDVLKKIKKSRKRKTDFKSGNAERKSKLAVKARQTKWAPVWAVLRKFGVGKRVHPSSMTKHRRSWRRTKLHVKPRKQRKSHFG